MRISVIVSTYNQPGFLERVLRGYALQTCGGFEVVIADDGSGSPTRALIERMRAETKLDILHVWHPDRGFRKSVILNRAIVASGGDCLLFTDGDCIPRADLVDTHRRLAESGRYLSGGYVKVPPEVSDRISVSEVRSGDFAELRWLRAQGWRPVRRALRVAKSGRLAALFDSLTPTRAHFGGNNASVWREALFQVNGFEGQMGYGGLDRALGYRLENLGVRGKQVRHRAVCTHLHHERPYRKPEAVQANRAVMDRIRRRREIRALDGIEQLHPEEVV